MASHESWWDNVWDVVSGNQKKGKSIMRNWTDQEIDAGYNRIKSRADVAELAMLEAESANEGIRPALWGPPRSKDETARLKNRYKAEVDSLDTVYNEEYRRRGRPRYK